MENYFKNNKKQMPEIIINTYRKLKSHIYYSNNIMYAKKMIADFEYNDKKMQDTFDKIVDYLSSDDCDSEYIKKLVNKVKFKVLPKVTIENKEDNCQIVSNRQTHEIKIASVNFFIDAPIEVWIFDMLWSLIIGYLLEKKHIVSKEVMANKFDSKLFSFSNENPFDNINFKNLSTFVPYFKQYKKWKNGAIYKMNEMYNCKEDSILFSLDISGYFYSVDFNFQELFKEIDENDIIRKCDRLNKLIELVYQKYTKEVAKYRTGISSKNLILPIGLVSSLVLGNYCLTKFDKYIHDAIKPIYYSRYVDDILILFKNDNKVNDDNVFSYISHYMPNIFSEQGDRICISFYERIYIQNSKIKIIKTDSNGSKAELKLLLQQISNTSEVNLLPNRNIDLENLYESIYDNNDNNIKIREIHNTSINKYRLMNYISSFLVLTKNTIRENYDSFYKRKENSVKKKLRTQFQRIDYETRQQLNILFQSNIVFDLYNRWDRLFLFLLLSNELLDDIKTVYKNLEEMILTLKLEESDKIYTKKNDAIKKQLIKTLQENLKISLSMGLAIRYEKNNFETVGSLPGKIRKSNMMDHAMISFPLVNYLENVRTISYHYSSYQEYYKFFKNCELDEKKIRYSPRFIHLREYCIYKCILFIEKIVNEDFINSLQAEYNEIRLKIGAVESGAPKLNCVSQLSGKNYLINRYNIVSKVGDKDDNSKLNIGLANINIEKTNVLNGRKINFNYQSSDYKYKIYQLLEDVHNFNKDKNNKNIRFLVFPELSIPIEWLNELAKYVQNTGVAIVCGIKYIKVEVRVYNLVAIILPITSDGGYKSSIVILRDKNDYSPLEKRIMENQNLSFNKSNICRYDLINYNNIKFSVFNCYELTDIYARANLRDKIDLLFAIEYNEDIGYFSNIVESSCRDMYSFVVQVNSSNFGDTRIIGPFDDKNKDIAHIKGGEFDLVHVGQINLSEFWDYLNYTKTSKYKESLDQQLTYKRNKKTKDKYRKYKKMSARTNK